MDGMREAGSKVLRVTRLVKIRHKQSRWRHKPWNQWRWRDTRRVAEWELGSYQHQDDTQTCKHVPTEALDLAIRDKNSQSEGQSSGAGWSTWAPWTTPSISGCPQHKKKDGLLRRCHFIIRLDSPRAWPGGKCKAELLYGQRAASALTSVSLTRLPEALSSPHHSFSLLVWGSRRRKHRLAASGQSESAGLKDWCEPTLEQK